MAEELPTREELLALPRRAIVAYAARCARRVQPLYSSKDKRHVQAVERAISLAERFAKGEPPSLADVTEASLAGTGRAADAAAQAADTAHAAFVAIRATAFAIRAADAARAAYDAARAADSAACAAAGDDSAAAAAADAAAGFAARAAADARALLVRAARGDYERLRSICPQASADLGDPIDPGEKGPLGPLWPNGPPEGWPVPVVKEQAGAEVEEQAGAEVEDEFARRARQARPAGLVSVYFDDCEFSDEETLLVLNYLGEVYRDLGGTGFKVAGGSTLVPAGVEVAP